MNPTHFRIALLGLTGLSLALSVAVLGTSAHTLSVYNSQHKENPWWLPLWTEHFDTHGTSGLIGASASVVTLSAVYIILCFVPNLHLNDRPHFRTLVSLATAVPSALVTLATVVYAHVLNHQSPNIDTIQTWTCRYGENPPMAIGMDIPSVQTNERFSSLCVESKFALYTTLVVFLLQAVVIAFALVTWVVDLWSSRKSKKEWKDGSSMEMSGNQSH